MNTKDFLWLLSRVYTKIKQNPAFIREIARYVSNDILSFIGFYNYPTKKIFIAGLPKSGTTWVETQLANIPGYNIRPIVDRSGTAARHDINDQIVSTCPAFAHSIFKTHTRWSEENIEVINRHFNRFMVMIRDLRDMTVSAYFHILQQADHRDHLRYLHDSEENGLMHRISVTAELYVPWVRDWLSAASGDPERILVMRYEDINKNPDTQFELIFNFFELPIDRSLIRNAAKSRIRSPQDFEKVRKESVGLRMKSTARKGEVGGWRHHFTAAHKLRFKELCGSILIQSGYEIDNNW